MQIVLIDGFVVPQEAREEFLSRIQFSADHIKTLPGFVEGYVHERTSGDSWFDIVTTAVWESDGASSLSFGSPRVRAKHASSASIRSQAHPEGC